MNAEQYNHWTTPLRRHPNAAKALTRLNQVLTGVCYVLYPLLIILLATSHNPLLLRAILVPGLSFAGLTILRRTCNSPRPYEVIDIDPLIKKDTRGKSFPSRHTFSCFIIALTWLEFFVPVGAMLLFVGIILAAVRVLGGVHFPRDVIAAAFLALACGLVGFHLIP